MQPLRSVCPAFANAKAHGERHHQICVPIEPVIPTEQLRDDPRHVTSKSRLHRLVRALNPRQFVYKQDALKCMNQSAFRRRVYLDVGANEYYTSIGFWFLQDYPGRDLFDQIYAFEADVAHVRSFTRMCIDPRAPYKCDPRVNLVSDTPNPKEPLWRPFAAWTKNTTLTFAGFGASAHATNPADEKKPYKPHSVPAIDLADFLRRKVQDHGTTHILPSSHSPLHLCTGLTVACASLCVAHTGQGGRLRGDEDGH